MSTAVTPGAKILIVDDSAMSRRMMRRILDGHGYAVIEEADGASALECYQRERPAVVMLDLIMPGIGGLEALVQLRLMDPNARVVIATADLQRATRVEAMSAGACGFVTKPFDGQEVLRAVAVALALPPKKEPVP